MPLEICPILESDIEEWTHLIFAAFQDDPVSKLMYPVPATPSLIAWTVQNTVESWGKDPTARHCQVKDTETGEMISAAHWIFFPRREGEDWRKVPMVEVSDDYHRERFTALITNAASKRIAAMGPQPYLYLPTLVTHPKHHRRGAATLLLKWGIDQASKQNLPINLTASPAGVSLYKKFGFQPFYETVIDLTPVGLSQHCVRTGMILPAPFPSKPSPPLAISPAISIEPVTDESDMVRLAEIESLAFVGNPILSLIFPPDPHGKTDHQVRASEHIQTMRERKGARYVKATDTQSGQIVAWAQWHFFDDLEKPPPTPLPENWLPRANIALGKHFLGTLEKTRLDGMKGKKYMLLAVLVTLPEYQRNGIGGKLLEWGLEQADEKGYHCWIDSSSRGLGLYKKHGWEEVGFLEVNLADYGGEEGVVDRTVFLVRKPRQRAKMVS
ncbi:MAG: hypothetical protein Q9187_003228 [Circinaria calcarea]